jgi:outer membrane immunogenic protein
MMNGWTIGAGVDYAINDRIFARAEYRYNDYGNADIDAVNIDFTQHVVQAGLGLKF